MTTERHPRHPSQVELAAAMKKYSARVKQGWNSYRTGAAADIVMVLAQGLKTGLEYEEQAVEEFINQAEQIIQEGTPLDFWKFLRDKALELEDFGITRDLFYVYARQWHVKIRHRRVHRLIDVIRYHTERWHNR